MLQAVLRSSRILGLSLLAISGCQGAGSNPGAGGGKGGNAGGSGGSATATGGSAAGGGAGGVGGSTGGTGAVGPVDAPAPGRRDAELDPGGGADGAGTGGSSGGTTLDGGGETPAPGGESQFTIYWVDTEGGAATIMRAPTGEIMVVDTGFPGTRDAARVMSVLQNELKAHQARLPADHTLRPGPHRRRRLRRQSLAGRRVPGPRR